MRQMKDSGIEWIGEIPSSWNTIKLKYLFTIISGNGFPEKLQGRPEGDFPFCKVSDINGLEDYVHSATNWITRSDVEENKYNIIPTSSIIMAKIGAALAKNHRKINAIECCIDNNTQALVPKRNDIIRFLLYLTKCIDMKWFDNNSTVPSVNNSLLLVFFVPTVPLAEQQRIADYLDRKCAEIDSVIADTQKSIEEYKALKQSIITEAVTKGIRGNRPMKDSGIEWIGEIPEEWEIAQLKRYAKVNNGKEIIFEVEKNNVISYPVYGSGGIFKYTNDYLYDGISIMFGRKGTLGKPLFVKGRFWAVDTMYYLTFNSLIIPRFNYYQLIVFDWEPFITHTAIPSIVGSEIINCKFAFPSLIEQQEIVAYLDQKCKVIDGIVNKKDELITELEIYKKSLIYECVTGKKEIPICQ